MAIIIRNALATLNYMYATFFIAIQFDTIKCSGDVLSNYLGGLWSYY